MHLTTSAEIDSESPPDFRPDYRRLLDRLGLDWDEAWEHVAYYNVCMDEYGNEIYGHAETRLAHLYNFLQQGWFARRMNKIADSCGEFDVFVDIGFSLPYPYFFSKCMQTNKPSCVFVDKERSAAEFYDALIDTHDMAWRRQIDRVLTLDIESAGDRGAIVETVRELEPKRLFVCCSEVIEHLSEPDIAWELIGRLSRLVSVGNATVYVTLPVGERIPSHNLEFTAPAEAMSYAKRHMLVEKAWLLVPPEGKVKPFAQGCYCFEGASFAGRSASVSMRE